MNDTSLPASALSTKATNKYLYMMQREERHSERERAREQAAPAVVRDMSKHEVYINETSDPTSQRDRVLDASPICNTHIKSIK